MHLPYFFFVCKIHPGQTFQLLDTVTLVHFNMRVQICMHDDKVANIIHSIVLANFHHDKTSELALLFSYRKKNLSIYLSNCCCCK